MFATGPANNAYLELLGEPCYALINTRKGMNNPRTVEVMLDVTLLFSPPSLTDMLLFGKTSAGWWFDLDTVATGTSATQSGMSFKVTRNATATATTAASPVFGKRITLWGRDNQTDVKAYSNGSVGSTVKTYTAAEASYSITTDANDITLGKSGSNFTALRLHEAAIRVNGIIVFHVRPKARMQYGDTPTILPDLSGFGNDMTISGGVINTNYRYASNWSKEMAYSGRENVG